MAARGGWLLLILMFTLTVYDLGRFSLPREERPALRVSDTQGMTILLSDNAGRLDGIHQINDAKQLSSVINLANLSLPEYLRQEILQKNVVLNGKELKFRIVNDDIVAVGFGWMPAAMRMALGIPLDTRRMSKADWDDLPGVGPSLAQRIEENRHKNGDFRTLDELRRVPGVGLKRIEKWRLFFDSRKLAKFKGKISGR